LNHQQLLELIRDRMDHPATPRELLQRLEIPRDERPTFKRLLADLVAQGALVETRGNRYGLPPFYELHAWLWKHNPAGMFDDWNPRVVCPAA